MQKPCCVQILKQNYSFNIIHGIKTFGYILLFSFPTKNKIKRQKINKQKIYTALARLV